MVKICCVCHRVKLKNSWVKGSQELEATKLSHCYCPRCYQRTMRQVQEMGRRFQPAAD